ncbi:unnamed protein product [Vitrella brassicaformis CCMP3155]|uniref:Uncharacterized protein n=1 Tax=Vitrella brassicaformis (strain CCMP3155) TaxID=1169540 RepID=A0A0G4H3K3_VITBC|nr:unnamed protein product [Vitrella brassicaformis CCMP3155]|eukprot:CEM38292.1 unnamed protein product [Vitrella brassicaformis CCMP3155]
MVAFCKTSDECRGAVGERCYRLVGDDGQLLFGSGDGVCRTAGILKDQCDPPSMPCGMGLTCQDTRGPLNRCLGG